MDKFVPHWWLAANDFLKKDEKMAHLIVQYSDSMTVGGEAFVTLCKSITGQQISVKAASSVFSRLTELCQTVTPNSVNSCSVEQLRGCGYSLRKAEYLLHLSKTFIEQQWDNVKLMEMPSETLQKELIAIRGIGEWTIEMFAMFFRGDADIFPIKDLGILKAIQQLYFNGEPQDAKTLIQFSQNWQPYRTCACWYLWRYLDNKPVQY